MIINNNVTALDASSSNLIKALMSTRSDDRNLMRDPESETSKTSKSVSDSITPITPSHYSYPMSSYSFYNSYESPLYQTSTLLHQTPTRSKSNNAHIDILNSPLISENDQAEKLMNYVD